MARHEDTLARVLSGTADANIAFAALGNLLTHLGFSLRMKGSHHIYSRSGVVEILNLQPNGPNAKAYQVKQVRSVILKYKLAGDQ